MGACFDFFTVSAKEDVKKAYDQYCKQAAYEDGHSYSGRLNTTSGLKILNLEPFNSEREADEWINSHAVKWGNALAVLYKNIQITPSKKLKNITKRIQELESKRINARHDLLETTVKRLKTKAFHTCKECKSKINTSLWNKFRNSCPVCNADQTTKADRRKLTTLEKKLETERAKAEAETKKLREKAAKKKSEVRWFVGGCCSC